MSKVPLWDKLSAMGAGLHSYMWQSEQFRMPSLALRRVRGMSAADIAQWAQFPDVRRTRLGHGVGVMAVDRLQIEKVRIETENERPPVRLGLAKAVGRAVVFGPIPYDTLTDMERLASDDDLRFGVRLRRYAVHVAPVFQLSDGSLRDFEEGVSVVGMVPHGQTEESLWIY